MKNRALKWIKKTVSMLVLTVVVVSGMSIPVDAARDTETEANGIVYVNYTDDYKTYSDAKKAPEYSDENKAPYGYVFGGWFTSNDGTSYTALDATTIGNVSSGVSVYAKFVPAYVLSVKCQNKSGTTAGMSNETALKVVSTLDSKNYASYGFEFSIISLNEDGTISGYNDWAKHEGTKAYDTFTVYEKDGEETKAVGTYDPEDVFGDASKYFTTSGVSGIKSSSFATIISIKPHWTTLDGTKVYGLTKYAHVEDGLLKDDGDGMGTYRYVNVPINLRKTDVIGKGVAAGVLSIDYSQAGATLEFAEVEGGRYFEEMAWADKSGSVKLVGNKSNISNDLNEDNIYANVRFKLRTSEANALLNGYNFIVSDEDFSDSAETQFTSAKYNVWDVKY